MNKTLRLILGDQLNSNHSWFNTVDDSVFYVMMEIRSETDYATHHIQKVVGIFAAMRAFCSELKSNNHQVIYIKLNDKDNLQSFDKNCESLISNYNFTDFEYQLPDEYRVDLVLKKIAKSISGKSFDSEHFYTSRNELGAFFEGKKTYMMESFYRAMRTKHNILMEGGKPLTGQWNYDSDNRKKIPKNHKPITPFVFNTDLSDIFEEINKTSIKTIGTIDSKDFFWPINRKESLQLLDFFLAECLHLFGSYQDAMMPNEWSLYHSRISFSMNVKMISPKEVVQRAIEEWKKRPDEIQYNQIEGFVR
ncbi:cryptochrome/photolyase family protein [Flavobacterium collinsii]|uniref:(6-4) photolyase n=1 Tax=Flavobacterium collinsii TaxID=1114861 RepID=A0ABM8KPE9_9FLAO|nr:cryptochrome/photolyase family protein [Flavobacterium collinsii]CAA9202464.1 (6-4) photolyase [Flavobacterium collinsii]